MAPPLATPRPQQKTIKQMLEEPAMVSRFRQVLPRHLNPERMLRVLAQCVHKTPKLAACDPMTLLGAMQACASLGLEPNTPLGHAYLIPFGTDVQLIIGYRGYIDLARRSGNMVSIHADVVYEGDDFDFFYGSGQYLKHRPRGNRGNPLEAYAYAKLTDGEAFEVLPYTLVLRVRDNSQGYKYAKGDAERNPSDAKKQKRFAESPWVANEHEMAAKTMVRRLAKWLPLSLEFANAATLDAMSEAGKADFAVFAEAKDLDEGLAAIEHDPETGEVTEPAQVEDKRAPAAPVDQGGELAAVDAKPAAAPAEKPKLFGAEG